MTTIALAQKKWERKMATAGPRWKKGVTDAVGRFASGMARFLGISDISPEKKTAWSEGTGAVSAEDFASAVKGKGPKWAERLKSAFM
ncbi:MAG: hypothetical protein ACE5KE_00305 [Methanosarcinales archaeon]